MDTLNSVVIDGRVYVAGKGEENSCRGCDLEDGHNRCIAADLCLNLGRDNIFRHSPQANPKTQQPTMKRENFERAKALIGRAKDVEDLIKAYARTASCSSCLI